MKRMVKFVFYMFFLSSWHVLSTRVAVVKDATQFFLQIIVASLPGTLNFFDKTIQIPTLNIERAWHHPKEFDPDVIGVTSKSKNLYKEFLGSLTVVPVSNFAINFLA